MKLPIGIQTFSKIREDDYVYVDKTKEALDLIQNYEYVFLSRPRRFGKSLFLDTLRNIFEGTKEYFKGLCIEDKWDFDIKYPVIHISFAGDMRTDNGMKKTFTRILEENQENLGIKCDRDLDAPSCLAYLIRKAYQKFNQRVVVLIDEYDKPILDNITDYEKAKQRREELKAFYEILKDNGKYLKFVFITGVSKFSKVSIFSGFNNLEDISLAPRFGNICGYTHHDIETGFKPLLEGVDLEELKKWYNGYNFLKDKVYNPFDILLFIRNEFRYYNYWFETGTPSFLVKLMKEENYYIPDLENIVLGRDSLSSFDIDNIDLEVLLFQAGYLTIKEETTIGNKIRYSLKIPNMEVKMSLTNVLFSTLTNKAKASEKSQNKAEIALINANLEDFKTALIALFASLPYENYTKNKISIYEGFYASVIYAYLASLGYPITAEESDNKGRLDMTILINNNRYILEFKVDGSNALAQIKEKKYYQKFLAEGSNIYLVGINFEEQKRNISKFEWEFLRS